jgi:hypothetical protein
VNSPANATNFACGVTTEQVNQKYTGTVYPEHPEQIRNTYPSGAGDVFDIIYTSAGLQAAPAP